MKKLYFVSIFILSFSLSGKVEKPNYSFTLETLQMFFPNAEFDAKKHKAQYLGINQGFNYYKLALKKKNYHLDLLLNVNPQTKKINQLEVRFPSYFLHDDLLARIQKKFGKQKSFKNANQHSVYRWEVNDKQKIIYEAGCAITCFPIYLSVSI